MARVILWADAAWDDLDAAAEYIARDSPRYAAALVRRILVEVRSLREHPLIGRMVPELQEEAVRELIVHRYRVIYRVTAERIIVLAVLHGARDLPRVWRRTKRYRL